MQGLHLSPVQDAAVELLLIAEERLKAESFSERFKMAVISADPVRWVPEMYPQWVKNSEPEEEVGVEDFDLADDGDPTTWVFEDVDPQEAVRTLEEMTAQRGGSLGWEDLTTGGDEEDW